MLAEQPHAFEQQIAEIAGVQLLQPLLVVAVELRAPAVGERESLALGHHVGGLPPVLPAVDQAGERPRGPAILVDPGRLDHLLDQPQLVVHVEDREPRLEAGHFRVTAQNLHADRMERPEPRHPLDRATDEMADALLHLARGLVGEGHRQDLAAARAPRRHDVGDASGQHARLAGARARQHQQRAVQRLDRLTLLGIETREVVDSRRHLRARARRDRTTGRRRRRGNLGRCRNRHGHRRSGLALWFRRGRGPRRRKIRLFREKRQARLVRARLTLAVALILGHGAIS